MKLVTEAYVSYLGSNGNTFNVPISMLKKSIKPSNFNKLDYIDYVANAFSYMISIHAYFTDRRENHGSSSALKGSQIIVSDEQLADAIGCSVSTSDRVMTKLKDIFGLEYDRMHAQGGARIITINQRVIDFLKIYSLEDFFAYKDKYDLMHSEHARALQQLFRYRAWGVKPKYLRPSEKQARQNYIHKMKDFFHILSTADNLSDYGRIDKVKQNQDKLSELNRNQLDRVIQEKKRGRLSHYWFHVLVRLYQKVTMVLRNDELTKKQHDQEAKQNQSHINSESSQGETVAHASATQKAQRIPEQNIALSPNDYIDIFVEWNNQLIESGIPNIKALSQNEINAIDRQVNSIGKDNLISCIKKMQGLKNVQNGSFKMTFDKFMTDKTIGIIMNASIVESEPTSWFAEHLRREWDTDAVLYIDPESVPTFNSIKEAAEWWSIESIK